MSNVFELSIEPVGQVAFRAGYHLGTDEKVARQMAEERFHGRNRTGLPTCTVALIRDRRVFDVYDGVWSSYVHDSFDD